jgi:hypothetical protein
MVKVRLPSQCNAFIGFQTWRNVYNVGPPERASAFMRDVKRRSLRVKRSKSLVINPPEKRKSGRTAITMTVTMTMPLPLNNSNDNAVEQ